MILSKDLVDELRWQIKQAKSQTEGKLIIRIADDTHALLYECVEGRSTVCGSVNPAGRDAFKAYLGCPFEFEPSWRWGIALTCEEASEQ